MIADDVRTSLSGMPPVARTFAKALAPMLALILTACSDSGTSDLREFVAEAKQRQGRVEPLPEFTPVQTHVYAVNELRDPFTSDSREMLVQAAAKSSNGVAPDLRRRKDVLESYPLDSLSMLGTLEFQNSTWGLVKAPDGVVHRIRPGTYMGQNYGKVKAIQAQRVLLTEIVPDGLGGWEEREAFLAMNEQ
jgi:type IV pilus assembly protein PilP